MRDDEPVLSESDVRAMVRLLGEVAGLDADIPAKKRFLMNGVCELVNAEKWLWNYGVFGTRDDIGAGFMMIHDGWTDREMATVYQAQYDITRPPPDLEHYLAAVTRRQPFTRARWQMVSDDDWYASPHCQHYRKGIADDFIVSFYPLPESDVWSVAGLYHNWDGSRFSSRDVRIVHVMMTEIPWLHMQGLPSDGGRDVHKLSPRQRTVLNMLLEAHGKKQIAYHLGLSEWTVNDYIKAIYRHFNVSSRAELLRRFMVGDGGDGL